MLELDQMVPGRCPPVVACPFALTAGPGASVILCHLHDDQLSGGKELICLHVTRKDISEEHGRTTQVELRGLTHVFSLSNVFESVIIYLRKSKEVVLVMAEATVCRLGPREVWSMWA